MYIYIYIYTVQSPLPPLSSADTAAGTTNLGVREGASGAAYERLRAHELTERPTWLA